MGQQQHQFTHQKKQGTGSKKEIPSEYRNFYDKWVSDSAFLCNQESIQRILLLKIQSWLRISYTFSLKLETLMKISQRWSFSSEATT